MKPNELKYFKVKPKPCNMQFEFTSLSDFYRYLVEHHVKSILVLLNEANEPTHFAVAREGALMLQATMAFQTLEDYLASVEHDFPDAAAYYDALQLGYKKYSDYKLVKEAGIDDKWVFDKMKDGGYITGYAAYSEWRKTNQANALHGDFPHPYALYQYATDKGFEHFSKFKKAYEGGFKDAASLEVATEKGFTQAADFEEATLKGANSMDDLNLFREKQVRDKDDFQKLLDLTFLHNTGCKHDECVLLTVLSKLDVGKRISINKLHDHYRKALEEYRYQDTGEMPPWFTTGFNGLDDIVQFLSKHEVVKQYGSYHSDGEFFETTRLQERKVVIDGSNVAYNNANANGNGHGKAVPLAKHIIQMVVYLKYRGFSEITVINDASLRHRVSDKENLAELKRMTQVLEAPAENPADIFIIHHVKRNHCLLVSNDTFREWKTRDPWVAENIDFYRLSFLINGSEVMMPDLEVA